MILKVSLKLVGHDKERKTHNTNKWAEKAIKCGCENYTFTSHPGATLSENAFENRNLEDVPCLVSSKMFLSASMGVYPKERNSFL